MVILCAKEVAGRLGLSPRSVARLFLSGQLAGFRAGARKWRTTELHLESYVSQQILKQRAVTAASQDLSDTESNLSPKLALFSLPRKRESA
jgi:AraC-like DNA-binding protein